MTDPEATLPDELRWNERAALIYTHGASEHDYDWNAADEALLREKLGFDKAALIEARTQVEKDLAYIAQCEMDGTGLMVEYVQGVKVWEKLVAWRGFGLAQDEARLRALIEASKGTQVVAAGIED